MEAVLHAECLCFKVAYLEVELEKAKGDLQRQQSRYDIERTVHDGIMRGTMCRSVLINFAFAILMLIQSSVDSADSVAQIAWLQQSLKESKGAKARLKTELRAEKDIISSELSGM